MSETTGFGSFGGATAVEDASLPEGLDGMAPEDGYEFTAGTGGGGQYKPRVTPGPITFRYEFQKFETKTNRDGVVINEITFNAHVQNAALGMGRLLVDRGDTETKVSFVRVSDYKSPKMVEKRVQSGFEELYQCLGLLESVGVPKSKAALAETLKGATGAMGQASLVWRAAKKVGDRTEIFSTSPNTGRGEAAWPARGADGKLPLEVKFSDGETKLGREEIGRFYAPKSAKK